MVCISAEHKSFLPDKALVEPGAFSSGENGGDHFEHIAIRLPKVRDMIAHHQGWKLSLLLDKDPSLPNLWRLFIPLLIRSRSFRIGSKGLLNSGKKFFFLKIAHDDKKGVDGVIVSLVMFF